MRSLLVMKSSVVGSKRKVDPEQNSMLSVTESKSVQPRQRLEKTAQQVSLGDLKKAHQSGQGKTAKTITPDYFIKLDDNYGRLMCPVYASDGHPFLFVKPDLWAEEEERRGYGNKFPPPYFVSLLGDKSISVKDTPLKGGMVDFVDGAIIWKKDEGIAAYLLASIHCVEKNSYHFVLDTAPRLYPNQAGNVQNKEKIWAMSDAPVSENDVALELANPLAEYAKARRIIKDNIIVRIYPKVGGGYKGLDVVPFEYYAGNSEIICEGMLSNEHYSFKEDLGLNLVLRSLNSKKHFFYDGRSWDFLLKYKNIKDTKKPISRNFILSPNGLYLAVINTDVDGTHLAIYDVSFKVLLTRELLYKVKISESYFEDVYRVAQWSNDGSLIFLQDGNLMRLKLESLEVNLEMRPVLLELVGSDPESSVARFDQIYPPFNDDSFVLRRSGKDVNQGKIEYQLKAGPTHIKQALIKDATRLPDILSEIIAKYDFSALTFFSRENVAPRFARSRELKINALIKFHETWGGYQVCSPPRSWIKEHYIQCWLCIAVFSGEARDDNNNVIRAKKSNESFAQYIDWLLKGLGLSENTLLASVREMFELLRASDQVLVAPNLKTLNLLSFFNDFSRNTKESSYQLRCDIGLLYEMINKNIKFFHRFQNKNAIEICFNHLLKDVIINLDIEKVQDGYLNSLKIAGSIFYSHSALRVKQQELMTLKKNMRELLDKIAHHFLSMQSTRQEKLQLLEDLLKDVMQKTDAHGFLIQQQNALDKEVKDLTQSQVFSKLMK